MSYYDESTPLEIFNYSLNKVSILEESSFFELYPWYYYDASELLKKEIIDNLTNLSEKKFDAYLKYTKDQIQEFHIFDPDESIIQKWTTEFNLKEEDFPFLSNDKIIKLIKPKYETVTEKDRKTYFIQRSFHLQAVKLEALKMMDFINALIDNKNPSQQSQPPVPVNNPYTRIFTNDKSYEIFEKLRDEFGVNKNVLANFSFVFHRMKKDGLIFDHLKQLEFIHFLSELNINIDRIKPKSQMGNEDLRESIYNRIRSI